MVGLCQEEDQSEEKELCRFWWRFQSVWARKVAQSVWEEIKEEKTAECWTTALLLDLLYNAYCMGNFGEECIVVLMHLYIAICIENWSCDAFRIMKVIQCMLNNAWHVCKIVVCLFGFIHFEYIHLNVIEFLSKCIEATDLELDTKTEDPVRYHEAWQILCSSNGVLIPGGFGVRGMEGKILAAEWARKTKKPFLG